MGLTVTDAQTARLLARGVVATVVLVLLFSAVNWVGWSTGSDVLTRGLSEWPRMTPWTAAMLAALGVAVLAQSGRPSRSRIRAGCAVSAAVAVLAVVFLAEYATARSFGLDGLWFSGAVNQLGGTWPGRPSPRTAVSALFLTVGIALTRVDRRWTSTLWQFALLAAAVLPLLTGLAYLFDVVALMGVTRATGMGISTAAGLLLLVAATVASRPDRNPLAWLMARPDRVALLRLGVVLAGLPAILGLTRLGLVALGAREGVALVFSVMAGTLLTGAATFYFSQREQKLLIDKEQASRRRAEAEARYRILAENLVDVVVLLDGVTVVHLDGSRVAWISPSVEAAFGDPPPRWIGTDFIQRVHPDDISEVKATLAGLAQGGTVVARFRVGSDDGDYHWVDARCKPYIDADGDIGGILIALRMVDDLVDAERRLLRQARLDPLTGLVNRGEAIARLEAALTDCGRAGPHLGLLFCDVDQFKSINDAWGHAAGDVVLATMADRIRGCVRDSDTVGRIGGDEMLVLLPGVHDLEEVAAIAEKIRACASEPIQHNGQNIRATLSIGAALSSPDESADHLTARADAAMYQAKQAGRNTVCRIPAPTDTGPSRCRVEPAPAPQNDH